MPSRDFRKGFVTAKPRDRAASVLSGTSGALYPIKLPSLPGATWSKVSGDANLSVSSAGVVSAISGLSGGASQTILVRGTVGNRAVEFQITLSARSDAPVLSSPVGTKTSATTATIGATTDKPGGILYAVVSTGGAPSEQQIQDGLNSAGATPAAAPEPLSVTTAGAKTFDIVGLAPATTYFAYFVQFDGLNQPSNVLASTAFTTDALADTTAPILSSPSAVLNGTSGASLSVTTDEAGGDVYYYLSTSATKPSATNLKSGSGSVRAGVVHNPDVGVISVLIASGLPAGTYYAHFLQVDQAGNGGDPDIVSSSSFTVAPVGSAPANTSAPVIAGSATIGNTLSFTSDGVWNNGVMSYAHKWQVETGVGTGVYADIAGANGTSQVVPSTASGLRMRGGVAATNTFGTSAWAYSNAIGPMAAGTGTALVATDLTYFKDGQLKYNRMMEWEDGDKLVVQYSDDPTFATSVTEVEVTLAAATLTQSVGISESNVPSLNARVAAYRGTRPASLLWGPIANRGDVIPPVLSVTSTAKTDGAPLADVISSNKNGPFALSGDDASLLELSTYQAATSVTVRLLGNALLNSTAKASYLYTVTQTDQITGVSSSPLTRSITVLAADTTPDPFDFGGPASGLTAGAAFESPEIVISGLGAGVSVSGTVSGGTYKKKPSGGSYGSASSSAFTAQNGDAFKVQGTASAIGGGSVTVTLTIGGVSDSYIGQTAGFNPLGLFLAGESGDFYDATDYSTMWQDTAGTVPVTGANQSVLRWVGKKHGRALIPIATNGPTTRVDGNGNKYLEFNAASGGQRIGDANLVQSCDAATGDMTVAVAASVADVTTNRNFAAWDNAGSNRVAALNQLSANGRMLSYTSATGPFDSVGPLVANTPFTLIGVRTGATAEAFKDNVSDGATTGSGTPFKVASPVYVGGSSNTPSTFNLYGGVLAIGRVLDATERGNLHSWLDNRS